MSLKTKLASTPPKALKVTANAGHEALSRTKITVNQLKVKVTGSSSVHALRVEIPSVALRVVQQAAPSMRQTIADAPRLVVAETRAVRSNVPPPDCPGDFLVSLDGETWTSARPIISDKFQVLVTDKFKVIVES